MKRVERRRSSNFTSLNKNDLSNFQKNYEKNNGFRRSSNAFLNKNEAGILQRIQENTVEENSIFCVVWVLEVLQKKITT